MTILSVNVNKIALLRNSRGKNNPDVLKTALDIISYGAQGITVHPRPDGRHIRPDDVMALKKNISVELNVEGYPDENYLALIRAVKPAQATLVPDPPEALTSDAGWDIEKNMDFLKHTVKIIQDDGVRTSLFIDPHNIRAQDIALLKKIGTDRVELYTESYAVAYGTAQQSTILAIYQRVAEWVHQENIGLNAGHDLNLANLKTLVRAIPMIQEVSIGHALICEALYLGLENTIVEYLACLTS